jgi:AAA15 family ATPase/GTPase
MVKAKAKKAKISRFNYQLKKLHISSLKGIKDFTLEFETDKRVTAVVGINGSGKSTLIHALACTFKPKGKQTSKDFNRLSHFFTPNKDASWDGSEYSVEFNYQELNPAKEPKITDKTHTEKYYKKPGVKQGRWLPIYARRHERESIYIGLHELSTLSEDKNAGKYKEYETEDLAHESADKIKSDMVYILGRSYEKLSSCTLEKSGKIHTMFGLTHGGVTYSEHSMGAGEKRVLSMLYALHSPLISNGGLLLIDEADVLLHGIAFKKLIERIVQRSKENKIEVVFTTHRETISEFSSDVNIFGILNTGNGVLAMPHTNPQVMHQLTGTLSQPLQICVEDELAEQIILNLVYKMHLQTYVRVSKFGAWSNAFAVLAGKKLMGQDITNSLCVLDGDVCRDEESRESECQRHLNGNDRAQDRLDIVKQIKEFKIINFAPDGEKGSPEFNIKTLFENSESTDIRINELQIFSKTIQGHADWHIYFDKMVELSGQRQVREKILDFLEVTDEWKEYTEEISTWLNDKYIELGLGT